MDDIVDTYIMNEAAVSADAFDGDYAYSFVEESTMFPHAETLGYPDDARWTQEWQNMKAGFPPTPVPGGATLPRADFTDLSEWQRKLKEDIDPALTPKPIYDLRWRQSRLQEELTSPALGPWRGYFAANRSRARIVNTYNSTDAVLFLAWPLAQRLQKPNVGLLGLSSDDRKTQFWAALVDTGPAQEYLWEFEGQHAAVTRQWAELANWFPAISIAAGQAIHSALENVDFTDSGGVGPKLSHTYLTDKPFDEVWSVYETLADILAAR